MKKRTTRGKFTNLLILLLLTAGAYYLWRSNQTSTENGTPSIQNVTYRIGTIKKAKSISVTFSNPKMGHCPVCDQPVNYESFTTVGRKHYALCSEKCSEILQAEPELYLSKAQNP